MTYAQRQDGVWRELRPTFDVIAADGRQNSWASFLQLSIEEQEDRGGFLVPEPITPDGKVETGRFLKPDGDRPEWEVTYVDAPPPPEPETEPAPEVISDRQFAQVLALDGVISQDEALAWAARGELPDAMEAALLHIPEEGGQQFGARMLLSAATTYERSHPLVNVLGAMLGKDAAALDDIWTRGAAL